MKRQLLSLVQSPLPVPGEEQRTSCCSFTGPGAPAVSTTPKIVTAASSHTADSLWCMQTHPAQRAADSFVGISQARLQQISSGNLGCFPACPSISSRALRHLLFQAGARSCLFNRSPARQHLLSHELCPEAETVTNEGTNPGDLSFPSTTDRVSPLLLCTCLT